MSLTDNNGTQYYGISCGVPSDPGVDINSNTGSSYYWLSAYDYILYGQPTVYPGLETNNTRFEYLYPCGVSSDAGLNLTANNGSKYYYNSAFNCVSFCDSINSGSFTIQSFMGDDMYLVYDEWTLESGVTKLSADQLDMWTGYISGNVFAVKPTQPLANKALVVNDEYIHINGVTNPPNSRYLLLSGPQTFGGNNAEARKTFWVMETNFHSGSGTTVLHNVLLGGYSSGADRDWVSYTNATSSIVLLDNALTAGTVSLSSTFLGGTHTYIIETGSNLNGGGFAINGVPLLSSLSGPYWSRNFWSIGHYEYGSNATANNTLDIKLKGIAFMKHPNATSAIPLSATAKMRAYLTSKYGVTS